MDDWIKVLLGVGVGLFGSIMATMLANKHRIEAEFRDAISRYFANMIGMINAYADREAICGLEKMDSAINPDLNARYVVHANHYNNCHLEATKAYGFIKRHGTSDTVTLVDSIESDWSQFTMHPDGSEWQEWRDNFVERLERLRDSAQLDIVKAGCSA